MECGPGVRELAGLAGFDRLGEDSVTVMVVEDHDIVVTSRGLDREFSGLIRVGFVEVTGGEDGSKNSVGASIVGFLGGIEIE
jgi:hypothetical protein